MRQNSYFPATLSLPASHRSAGDRANATCVATTVETIPTITPLFGILRPPYAWMQRRTRGGPGFRYMTGGTTRKWSSVASSARGSAVAERATTNRFSIRDQYVRRHDAHHERPLRERVD